MNGVLDVQGRMLQELATDVILCRVAWVVGMCIRGQGWLA